MTASQVCGGDGPDVGDGVADRQDRGVPRDGRRQGVEALAAPVQILQSLDRPDKVVQIL